MPATTVRIRADADRKRAVERVTTAWARSRGITVMSWRRSSTGPRRPEDGLHRQRAGRHRGVARLDGKLAADGSVVPLFPKKTSPRAVPNYALNAFSYGKTASRLYGVFVALENVGLVVNTRLAKVPKSWADLEKRALAFKRGGPNRIALAVQQGSGGDAYHMYPFFSGLCGYIFGRNRGGALNPNDVGLGNKGLPQERAHDRPVEPDRPHQREGDRQHRQERLPRG